MPESIQAQIPKQNVVLPITAAQVSAMINEALAGIGESSGGVADLTYKSYRAYLNQVTEESNPVATIFENTLSGAITWVRTSQGEYTGTLVGVFLAAKTFISNKQIAYNGGLSGPIFASFTRIDNDTILINVIDSTATPVDIYNSSISDVPVEILVFD